MHTKEEIFKDIQRIMNEDYAGYIDSRDLNHPELYTVANDMSEEEFLNTIEEYLLDFNDGHLWFESKNKNPTYVGFSVRRYENTLYVIDVSKESKLIVGDEITLIDGVSIEELAVFCKTFLHNIAAINYTILHLKDSFSYLCLDSAFFSRKLSPVKLNM